MKFGCKPIRQALPDPRPTAPAPLPPTHRVRTLVVEGPFAAGRGWMCGNPRCGDRQRAIRYGQSVIRDIDGDYFHTGCVVEGVTTTPDLIGYVTRAQAS